MGKPEVATEHHHLTSNEHRPQSLCSVAIFGEISLFWGNFGPKRIKFFAYGEISLFWGNFCSKRENFFAFGEIPHLANFKDGQFF
jgi:hypothetical protein